VTDGSLTAGHVRPLLALEDPVKAGEVARRAAREGWSVRQVEERVKQGGGAGKGKRTKGAGGPDPVVQALQEELRSVLGTRVVLRQGRKGKGVIEVPFLSPEDFERVFLLLTGKEASSVVE
jgi:ParB family chromosome partitioning protein